jgi:APA family basic amino acid/polyamine antiporter
VSYVIIPFLRDIALALHFENLATLLNEGWMRVMLALIILWTFVLINIRGIKLYERTVIPLMLMMFGLGAIVIVTGLTFNQTDFAEALLHKEGKTISALPSVFNWPTFLAGAALLFSSFIGFDSIAQAGGEAKNPSRLLPKAIGIAILTVTLFYFIFTFSLYHTVPWSFVAQEAQTKDVTAPGLLSYVMPSSWAVLIIAGAAVALLNDLPAMILSVSRLMFSWAEDGIFPKRISTIHASYHTPHVAIVVSGLMASVGIIGSHFAGDFFLGIDIMVTSMLVNYLLMCVSVLLLPRTNPSIAKNISVFKSRVLQQILAGAGALWLCSFLIIHIIKDLSASVDAWYFHSTPVWVIVMMMATVIFSYNWRRLKKSGVDTDKLFSTLPVD